MGPTPPHFKSHRIWTEPDEIRFLRGLLDSASDSLVLPRDLPIFYERFSRTVSQPYTKSQLSEKLRHLRKKFCLVSSRLANRGFSGELKSYVREEDGSLILKLAGGLMTLGMRSSMVQQEEDVKDWPWPFQGKMYKKKKQVDKQGPSSGHLDIQDQEMDIRKIMKDVENFGYSHMSWKERKKIEDKKIVSLGGKAPKKQRLPLSVARPMMKKQKEREQAMLQERLILGQFGGKFGGGSKRSVGKHKPGDRGLKASEGRFKNGVLNVGHLLNSAPSRDNATTETHVSSGGKKKKGNKMKKFDQSNIFHTVFVQSYYPFDSVMFLGKKKKTGSPCDLPHEYDIPDILVICLKADFDLTGQLVWPGAMLLNDYFSKNSEILQGRSAIELGSGVGITGVLCGRFCQKVVLTDHNDEILKKNIELHSLPENSSPTPNGLEAEKLEWGNSDQINQILQKHPGGFDLILGADIYIHNAFISLSF
ncbi:uncharacterized protein G2W53_015932 [Senna tora]|uniref:Glabrous enhancer-binding protein-like DBD domain-containing protein n=1 Tax=Senna tora TaxID=362788 RepID=A0A834WWG7_9FABA|nr:uncharacterized protein G2W53_015932 [Senna tora]